MARLARAEVFDPSEPIFNTLAMIIGTSLMLRIECESDPTELIRWRIPVERAQTVAPPAES